MDKNMYVSIVTRCQRAIYLINIFFDENPDIEARWEKFKDRKDIKKIFE